MPVTPAMLYLTVARALTSVADKMDERAHTTVGESQSVTNEMLIAILREVADEFKIIVPTIS